MLSVDEKRTSNTERAYHALRELILSGDLAAGTDHLETELAGRLGMSRTPVREAALMLEANGLLEVRPRKGVRILSLTVNDMKEVYDVLTELESLAARRAAEAQYQEADLQGLASAIDEMDKALVAEDRRRWAAADDRFHTELVRLGRNKRVEDIVAMMADQVRRARTMTLFVRPLPLKSNEDHRAVYQAILAGDAVKAAKMHHEHRLYAGNELTRLLLEMQVPRF